MLNLDDTEIQVQTKLQDVLKAVKAVVGVRKKGRGKSDEASNADRMVPSDLIVIPYIQLAVGLLFRGHASRFLGRMVQGWSIRTKLVVFGA